MRNRACAKFHHRADSAREGALGSVFRPFLKPVLPTTRRWEKPSRTLTLEE